ncbi:MULTISPECIES: hypothetical protein [Myxococcus]|uniref:hypothetical protein n=1 Tax=Myxococcus TaxID=32 RepID=UPI0011430B1C|nr:MULTISPECIES: hypothetical protein [Myxococcus]
MFSSATTRVQRSSAPIGATAASNLASAATGVALKQALQGLLGDIQARAHILGDELTTRLSNEVKVAISQLDSVLGTQITKPLNELNSSARTVADRATVIATQARGVIDAAVKCAGSDAHLIIQGATASLAATGGDISFWREDMPFVGLSYALGYQSRMGMYVGREPTPFRIVGGFPGLSPQQCGMPTVALGKAGNEVPVVSADHRSIVVVYPSISEAGVFPVVIKYRSQSWHGCRSKPIELRTFLVVAPAPEFKISYSALANCGTYERQTKSISTWIPNDKCQGDKHGDLALCADPGWELDSTTVNWIGCNGDRDHSHFRDNNCGRAKWTVPEQEGFLCTGSNKSGGAELFITQRRLTKTPAKQPITGTSSRPATYNTSTRLAVFDPLKTPSLTSDQPPWECEWTVSASVRRPDGTITDIPARTGVGSLTSASADGVSYDWNPLDGSITVTSPPYSCDYFQ